MKYLDGIEKDLLSLKVNKKAEILSRFFKTGKGEYGEGDIFLGISVPKQREIAKKYPNTSIKKLQELLLNKIHEYRLTVLLILINKYKKADKINKKIIFDFYLKNTKNINNWDLVDLSAPNIVGEYLLISCSSSLRGGTTKQSTHNQDCTTRALPSLKGRHAPIVARNDENKDKLVLYKLAKSNNLWEKRIAIITTYEFIRNDQFEDTLKIARILLKDKHDLIHKAVGWMLREVGKKDQDKEEEFLKKYYKEMPRTMLKYAIERFNEKKRKYYLGR